MLLKSSFTVMIAAIVVFAAAVATGEVAPASAKPGSSSTATSPDDDVNPRLVPPKPPVGKWTGQSVAPGNVRPERDARGIRVISGPAIVPPGVNQPLVAHPGVALVPNPNQAAAFATQPATIAYPACSRTVTDHCVQAYERGRPR